MHIRQAQEPYVREAFLAIKHQASIGCPITTGIFAMIAARAAAEQQSEGKTRVTPYWRTLKGNGELNPKYPGGLSSQRALLEREGHKIIARGKKLFVDGYTLRLEKL